MALMRYREKDRTKWVGTRPGHYGEQVLLYNSTNNNTLTIYTVPGGKRFSLVSYFCSVRGVALGRVYCQICNSVGAGKQLLYQAESVAGTIIQPLACSFTYPVEMLPTETVKITSLVANLFIYCGIHGWIEDA